jgi:hypothetical protein
VNLTPKPLKLYHIFLASPGDVGMERQHVRRFFDEYNRHTAHIWNVRFEVIDWENYSSVGVGRPQELITQQTLEKYKGSLALVVGIMSQRFGSPTGKAESGTEEEFSWAMASNKASGFPEIKWFFRKVDKLEFPSDPDEADAALDQWKKVRAFRKQMHDLNNPLFYAEYPSTSGFAEVFERDLNQWLADPSRPWAAERAAYSAAMGDATAIALPAEFDAERYRAAVQRRFDKLNFEMLDATGAFYNSVRLWSVFVPQLARECHQYNPRLLEIPKEHQRRLLDAGEINAKEIEETEREANRLRQEYFQQPLRAVLDVVDEAFRANLSGIGRRLVILGDPGSGKSSLIRYLALRWAGIAEATVRETQPIPLVIDLGAYARWRCDGRKDFIRFLEEAPVWHEWPRGLLAQLIKQPGRLVMLLDGLDEVFDVSTRESVVNDIARFGSQFANVPIVLTSRVVGYQHQRLRDAEFRHFMLQDLDSTQITDFLNRWHEVTFDDPAQATPKRDRLQKAIRESRSIAMLAGNPLLLTMMAILNRNQELPRDRADLYAQASRLLLHQWDMERALVDFPDMSTEIGLREKTDILRRIAAHMQANPGGLKGNLIDGTTLTDLIEGYLKNELHFAQARAAARAVVEHLRQRTFILCFVGADSYAFVHRTFLEYFSAAELVHRFNVAKTLEEPALIDLFDQHCRDDEWREVLRLICGQIDETFVGRVVERLATRTGLEEWDGKTPLAELPLAIGCLSEVRSPSRLDAAGRKLLAAVVDCFLKATDPPETFVLDMVAAGREMGPRWPGKHAFKFVGQYPESSEYFHHWRWPHFLAAVFEHRPWIETLSRCSSWDVRRGSMEVLAEKWPDQSTRDLLTRRAVEDESESTRNTALQSLVAKWPDQSTRDLLTRRAVEDESESTRNTALQSLVAKWPDQITRDLLTQRAVEDNSDSTRDTALQALVETWPDQITRDLLTQRAVEDNSDSTRDTALQALVETWPDQITRELLTRRAVEDDGESPRDTALQALVATWPDQITRELLTRRAVEDDGESPRDTALQALVATWPDQITRELLARRAVEDEGESPRDTALQALVAKWPDQITRELLTRRAVEDEGESPRDTALQGLVEKWPDQITRELLTRRAVEDEGWSPRSTALQTLVAKWPDQITRELLTRRAVEDEGGSPRSTALQALVAKWPDQITRELLTRRAVEDESDSTRITALQALVAKWPDQITRELLTRRAVEDEGWSPRSTALRALVEKWPDQITCELLTRRAVEDCSAESRGAAWAALGKMHSWFGHILPTRDLDGIGPYLDPWHPIPRKHIEKAAARARVRPDDIAAQISSLSTHCGWDVTVGAKHKDI